MRPVALDDPAHFGIDRFNGVELLNLLPDGLPAPPARADAVLGKIPSASGRAPERQRKLLRHRCPMALDDVFRTWRDISVPF